MKGNEIIQTDYYSLSTTIISTPSNNISKFTTAHDLLVDKFSIEISNSKKQKKERIDLTIGDKVCFEILI